MEEVLNFDVDVELNFDMDELLPVLLVVVEDPTEAIGWSLLFSYVELLSADLDKDRCP